MHTVWRGITGLFAPLRALSLSHNSGVNALRGTLPWTAPEIIRTPSAVTEKVGSRSPMVCGHSQGFDCVCTPIDVNAKISWEEGRWLDQGDSVDWSHLLASVPPNETAVCVLHSLPKALL